MLSLSAALPLASAHTASPAARQRRGAVLAAQLAKQQAPSRLGQAGSFLSGDLSSQQLSAPCRARCAARAHRRAPAVTAAASQDVVAPPGSLVLVAGASGGVGQLCVASLLDNGYRVRAVVRSAERARTLFGKLSADTEKRLEIVAVDLREREQLAATGVCKGVDAVISATGTTAFPSARWKGDNGPEQTDLLSASNLIRTVQEQSGDKLKRFVFISSVGVTRQKQFPYVILNAFGVLKFKRMSEQILIDSGMPFTLLRPGRLTDGPYTSYDLNTLLKATSGTKRAVQIATGDTLTPEATSRLIVAEAAVQALSIPSTAGRDFDLASTEGAGPGRNNAAWAALFAGAHPAGNGSGAQAQAGR